MRRIAFALVVTLAAFAIGCDSPAAQRDTSLTPVSERTAAPDFMLPNLRGGPDITLAQFAGKPVLVNFWASWCEPCKRESPALAAFSREVDDVQVLGVAVNDAPDDSRRFAEAVGMEFDLATDRRAGAAGRFGVTGLPVSVLIDDRGRVATTWFGEITRAELDALVAALASG